MDARELWGLGDYAEVAESLYPVAEALVDATGVRAGHTVLDVAAGTGNVTEVALRRGATVVASDIAPRMLELGRRRLPVVEWVEADAMDLPFEDERFDRVLSAHGAMFAPDPARTAAELLRVTRTDGVVGMTTWAEGSIMGQTGRLLAQALSAGSAELPAERWQDPEQAREHFASAGEVTVEHRTLARRFASPETWVEFLSTKAPPIVAARAAVGPERWPEVAARIADTVRDRGTTTEGDFVEETPYLVIVARR